MEGVGNGVALGCSEARVERCGELLDPRKSEWPADAMDSLDLSSLRDATCSEVSREVG